MKFKREFKLTEFEPPTKIRWSEISTARHRARGRLRPRAGGRGQDPADASTTCSSRHGFGKLIVGFALRSARKGADDFARSIKDAVEGEVPAAA